MRFWPFAKASRNPTRLILHVGIGKTGSTAVQVSLMENEEVLAAQGIRSFQSNLSKPGMCFKHRLKWKDLNNVEWRRLRREAASLAGGGGTVIFSSEGLWLRSREELELLARIFKRFQVTVLIYVREQVAFLESRALESLKPGKGNQWGFDLRDVNRVRDTEQFLDSNLPRVDFLKVGRMLEDVFGAGSVHARVYDRDKFSGNSVVTDFYEVIGASGSLLQQTTQANPSLTLPFAAMLAHQDHFFGRAWPTEDILDVQWRYAREGRRFKRAIFDDEFRAETRSRFEESNAEFFRDYVRNGDGFTISDDPQGEPIDMGALTKEVESLMTAWPLLPRPDGAFTAVKDLVFSEGWSSGDEGVRGEVYETAERSILRFRLPEEMGKNEHDRALGLVLEGVDGGVRRKVVINGHDLGEIEVGGCPIPIAKGPSADCIGFEVVLEKLDRDAPALSITGFDVDEIDG